MLLDAVLARAKGSSCIFEKRPLRYRFGVLNYGEIPGFTNPADGDPWDILAPGYSRELPHYKPYKIRGVLGVYVLENGNHKIAVRVGAAGYRADRCSRDIAAYCKNYSAFTNVRGIYMPITELRLRQHLPT